MNFGDGVEASLVLYSILVVDPERRWMLGGEPSRAWWFSMPATGIGHRLCFQWGMGALCCWLPLVSRHRLGWCGAFALRSGAIFCPLGLL